MKLRNLANKFLLVMLLAVLALGNYAFNLTAVWVGTPTNLTTAAVVSSKTYYLDQFNDNQPTGETLYEALGITVYNDYLTALSATQDLNEVVIAVVDTGLDCTSPVFTDRILSDYAVDFSRGIPAAADNTWYVDKNGHGTHVAGIIADATPANVKILPIKIFDGVNNSVNDGAALENAIRWLCMLKSGTEGKLAYCVENYGNEETRETSEYYNKKHNKIENLVAVNLSIGTNGFNCKLVNAEGYNQTKANFTSDKADQQRIIDNLLKNDILPIAAAGNRGSGEDNGEAYYCLPGACDGVLAVSAYDNTINDYELASFSYYNNCIGVAAPGAEIWSICSSKILNSYDLWGEVNGYQYYKKGRVNRKDSIGVCTVIKDSAGNYYLRDSGTSMATPFVTACYALLMSDSSKSTAADFGLTSWDPQGEDAGFMNVVHKALLAAAATDGDHLDEGYEITFGYGTVDVGGFVPDSTTGSVRPLNDIGYETQPSTNYQNASFENNTVVYRDTDWTAVCIVLAIGILLIWAVNRFKEYAMRRKTDEDEQ